MSRFEDERWAAVDAGVDLYDDGWPPQGCLFDNAEADWAPLDQRRSMYRKGRHRPIEVAASIDDYRPEWAGEPEGEK